MGRSLNALMMAHDYIERHIQEGSLCIDATAGRGRDTSFLCQLVGDSGKVLAFDIQEDAIDSTRTLLLSENMLQRVELILDSHSNMEQYAEAETVDCITFNFGWLPGGDHTVFTHAESSIKAIEAGLRLIKPQGFISLIIYYGGDSGFEERDALLEYLPTLDNQKYTVLITEFANRPNNPPIPVFILKE